MEFSQKAQHGISLDGDKSRLELLSGSEAAEGRAMIQAREDALKRTGSSGGGAEVAEPYCLCGEGSVLRGSWEMGRWEMAAALTSLSPSAFSKRKVTRK